MLLLPCWCSCDRACTVRYRAHYAGSPARLSSSSCVCARGARGRLPCGCPALRHLLVPVTAIVRPPPPARVRLAYPSSHASSLPSACPALLHASPQPRRFSSPHSDDHRLGSGVCSFSILAKTLASGYPAEVVNVASLGSMTTSRPPGNLSGLRA